MTAHGNAKSSERDTSGNNETNIYLMLAMCQALFFACFDSFHNYLMISTQSFYFILDMRKPYHEEVNNTQTNK